MTDRTAESARVSDIKHILRNETVLDEPARVSPDREALARRLKEFRVSVLSQPNYPDTKIGMRQQWVKEQIVAAWASDIEAAAALLRRLSSPSPAVGEWMDIAGAPKSAWPQNGRVIILGRAGEWAIEGFWVTSEDEREDFWSSDYNSDDGEWTRLPDEPTHWRECVAPPPAPPQETKP